ncbi:hypothetical protein [Vibrio sp. Hal054]|uniref:hypothetical protein n=1 Tax=Vibrio sp. Hal054 TaxID=3035158 RepID=UPI00301BA0A6
MTFSKKHALASLVLVAAMGLSGCASPKQEGRAINFAKLERVSVGISTQDDVEKLFGYAQSVEYPDDRTVLKYRYTYSSHNENVRQAVDFVFNKAQRLVDVTINDGQTFEPAK